MQLCVQHHIIKTLAIGLAAMLLCLKLGYLALSIESDFINRKDHGWAEYGLGLDDIREICTSFTVITFNQIIGRVMVN